MAIRVIFAPLAGRESDKSVLAAACTTARRFNAHVDVLSLCADPRATIPYLGEGISGALVEEFIAQAELENTEQTRKVRAEFDKWREATGFIQADTIRNNMAVDGPGDGKPTCSWREIGGAGQFTVASEGRLADLIIAPRGDAADEMENERAFESALMQSGRPLLLAPSTVAEGFGKHVAVAWDGSAEAARAVGAAMPFLRAADNVTAIAVAEEGKHGTSLEGLARYLSWHGIQANIRTVRREKHSIGEQILGCAIDQSADFLVMGAYSHNRYRELIFGSVTRYILDVCMLPVLITH